MEMESLCCGNLTFERVVCYVREATLLFEKSLIWFLFTFGSLLNDATLKMKWVDEEKRGQFADAEYDDAGQIVDEGPAKEYVAENDQDDDDGDGMSGEEGSDDGDGDSEDNAYASGDGGSDEDEDDDGFWDEDEEEEDYEEEEMDHPPSEKTRSLPTSSDETTGSEYEEGTDDDSVEASLLKHAREVYISDSFRMYKDEYKKSRTLYVDVSDEGSDERGLFFEYKAEKIGHHFREHTVTALPLDGIVNCSCKYFDVAGILCSHAQFVLRCLRIERIPDRYILKRRTKNESGGNVEDPSRITEDQKPTQPSSPDCFQHSRVSGIGSDDDTKGPEDDEDKGTDCVDPPMLSHAREIYIPDIFCMFLEEYRKSEFLILDVFSETYDHRGIVYECEISKPGHYKYRKVHAESKNGTVNCSCKKFEYAGVLCSHALYVLDCLCIERIPTQYILDRFLKDSTRRIEEGIHGKEYANLEAFTRYKILKEKFGSLVNMAAKSEQAQRIVSERLNELRIMLEDLPEEQTSSETDEVISCEGRKGMDLNVSGSMNNAEEKEMTKFMDLLSGGKLRSTENELK